MIINGKRRRSINSETDTATFRRFPCDDYALVESVSKFDLSKQWLIMRVRMNGEYVVGRHRKEKAAVKALEKLIGE